MLHSVLDRIPTLNFAGAKIRRQASGAEHCLVLRRGLPPPFDRRSIRIEIPSELPPLLDREGLSTRDTGLLAPPVNVFFRLEEQHRPSSEFDVNPPCARGQSKMDSEWPTTKCLCSHLDFQRFLRYRPHHPAPLQCPRHPTRSWASSYCCGRAPETVSRPQGMGVPSGFCRARS